MNVRWNKLYLNVCTAQYGLVFNFGIGFAVENDFVYSRAFNYDIKDKIKSQLILHDV